MNNLPPVISAFANTNPGVIFVGIHDDGEVCGLMVAHPHEEERIKQQIRDIVQNRVDPLVIPILKYFEGVASAIVCDGVSAAAVVFAPEYGNEDEHPI